MRRCSEEELTRKHLIPNCLYTACMLVIPPTVRKECEELNARRLFISPEIIEMMGLRKSGFFLLVLLLQLHLFSTHETISQENPLVTDTHKQQNVHARLQEKAAVSRRGGGGGGHGSGGGHGGSGGHGGGEGAHPNGHGDSSPHTQGGGAVIPLYAAGAAGGAQNHRNDNHHHGSNNASLGRSGLNYLLCTILVSVVFVHFM